MTAAAESAWFAGRAERALMLLEGARPLVSEPIQRADIDRFLGLIEMTRGVPADACRLLLRAATEVAPIDEERALQLLNLAGLAAAYAGDREAAVAIAEVARGLAVADNPFVRMLAAAAHRARSPRRGRLRRRRSEAPRRRSSWRRSSDDDAAGEQPVALLFAGRAALYLGDDEAAYRTHHEAAARARASGALSIVTQILPRLATAEVWAGRWPSAAANAREGIQLAREIGQHDLVAQQLVLLGLIAALRGSEDECRVAGGRESGARLCTRARDRRGVSRSGRWQCWSWDSVGRRRRSGAVERSPRRWSSSGVRSIGSKLRSARANGNRARLAGWLRAVGGEQRRLPGHVPSSCTAAHSSRRTRAKPNASSWPRSGRARRGRPSLRAGPQRARLRRVPSPRPAPSRGARAPASGSRPLRGARSGALGGAGAGRAAGERPDGAQARPEHDEPTSPRRSFRSPVSSRRASRIGR